MPIEDYKIILDVPSSAPALGFGQCASALKDIIEGSRPQFAIGIFGTWGSGKTTLMRAIEERLDPRKTIPVQFSAWRYEKEPHLIVPLLDAVREALVAWAGRNATVRQTAIKTASTVGKAIYSLLAGLSFKVGVPNAIEVSFLANESLAKAREFSEEEKAARVPRSFYHAAFHALSESFREFLGPESSRRIVVFVDDLDRCLPQGALEVLEAMKLFFDLEGFVFVVGLDRDVVVRSIDVKYRIEPGPAEKNAGYQIRGEDYIKKIFQVPYSLAPVAITQLDEFLGAAYAESNLPRDQEAEFREKVAPHLRYIIGESGVNPREIKRYLNAYTLVVKIKPHLDRDVTLALQTIAFRSDWQLVSRALLGYREVFTDAVARQLGGVSTAIRDLDPNLVGIPESFMSYVTAPNPGAALLSTEDLREYLYAGEAARSTLGSAFIDLIRDVTQLATLLRKFQASSAAEETAILGTYSSTANGLKGRLKEVTRGRADRIVQEWTEHTNNTPWPNAEAGKPIESEKKGDWSAEEETYIRRLTTLLMELYSAGSQASDRLA